MDNCILCGKDLYINITFYNLFKIHYYIHEMCLKKLNTRVNDTFPFLNKMVSVEYLFDEIELESNNFYLFLYYGKLLLQKVLEDNNWSVCIFIDDKITDEEFILVTNLCEEKLVILQIFDDNFLCTKKKE